MSRSYALLLEYDGGPFAGWQRQTNALSVQQVIEEAASHLNNGSVPTSVAAGQGLIWTIRPENRFVRAGGRSTAVCTIKGTSRPTSISTRAERTGTSTSGA